MRRDECSYEQRHQDQWDNYAQAFSRRSPELIRHGRSDSRKNKQRGQDHRESINRLSQEKSEALQERYFDHDETETEAREINQEAPTMGHAQTLPGEL